MMRERRRRRYNGETGDDRASGSRRQAAMEITVQSGDISAFGADAVVVNLFEGVTAPGGATGAIDRAMGDAISSLIAAGDLRGKRGEVTLIQPLGTNQAPRAC